MIRDIRVYNHHTKEHYYLEQAFPKVGESNLVFVDFPRTDAPVDSWSQHATQYAIIRAWGHINDERQTGDFVRYKITGMNNDNYCTVSDDYNKENSGTYASDAFYKINKIFKA